MSRDHFTIDLGMMTHVGQTRSHNEDSIRVYNAPKYDLIGGRLFIVADGVGGESYGEVASQIAVNQTGEEYYQFMEQNSTIAPAEALRDVLAEVNTQIYEEALQRQVQGHMATTIVAAILRGDQLTVAWVGDSRAYLAVPGESIRQITRDHTHVEEQVRNHLISRAEADSHPRRNVLSRSLGGEAEVEMEAVQYPMQSGHVLVMCSDGLTRHVPNEEIGEIVLTSPDSMAAVNQLINRANERGGRDNISVIVVRIGERVPIGGSVSEDVTFVPEAALPAEPATRVAAEAPTRLHQAQPQPQFLAQPGAPSSPLFPEKRRRPWWLWALVGLIPFLVLIVLFVMLLSGHDKNNNGNLTTGGTAQTGQTIATTAAPITPTLAPTTAVSTPTPTIPTDTPLPPSTPTLGVAPWTPVPSPGIVIHPMTAPPLPPEPTQQPPPGEWIAGALLCVRVTTGFRIGAGLESAHPSELHPGDIVRLAPSAGRISYPPNKPQPDWWHAEVVRSPTRHDSSGWLLTGELVGPFRAEDMPLIGPDCAVHPESQPRP